MKRKQEQVEVGSTIDVESGISAGWEDIHFLHQCLPEINKEEIDLAVEFLGRRMSCPLVISALTGGYPQATGINKALGRAAEHFGLIMEVGSQRPMIDFPQLVETYSAAREAAPHAFLIANIGAAQLIAQKGSPSYTLEQIEELVKAINADALAIHLNFLQEAVVSEGDVRARGCLEAIVRVASSLSVPVIVKETGAGVSKSQTSELKSGGMAALDVGGAGGASMALLESRRAALHGNQRSERLGQTFANWGIPTAISLVEARTSGLPIIASGGVRNGLEAAKALALGASMVGIGRPLLGCVLTEGYEGVREWIEEFLGELSIAMFLVGASTIKELQQRKVIIVGLTGDWLEQLDHTPAQLSQSIHVAQITGKHRNDAAGNAVDEKTKTPPITRQDVLKLLKGRGG